MYIKLPNIKTKILILLLYFKKQANIRTKCNIAVIKLNFFLMIKKIEERDNGN